MKTEQKVHPAALVFPMMTDDELDELATDIKNNGQQFPIIRDNDDVILDGRNRLEACKRGGVEPKFDTLRNGEDPVAFILSANLARRHISKGRQAMVVAKIYPEPEKGGRGKKAIFNIGFSKDYVNKARTVLRYAPDLADSVLDGTVELNSAYETARMRKMQKETREDRAERLEKLPAHLATLVVEEKMSLAEAEAAEEKRRELAEKELRIAAENLETALSYLSVLDESVTADQVAEGYHGVICRFPVNRLEFAEKTIRALIVIRKEHKNDKNKER